MSEEVKQHQGELVGYVCGSALDAALNGRIGAESIAIRKEPSLYINKPLYTHADPGEVERLRAEIKHLKHTSVKEEVFDIVCKERDTLRAQLAERDALLRDAHEELVCRNSPIANRIDAALSASAEPIKPQKENEK